VGVWGDYDNDGRLDIFVSGNPERLWHNEGDGTFRDVSATAGDIDDGRPSEGAAWADYDEDGLLDIYATSYEDWNGGNPIYYRDHLLHNDGGGRFTDVSDTSGIYDGLPEVDLAGRGAAWADYDNDGDIDLYVSNYRLKPNLMYMNDGSGHFTNIADDNGTQGTEKPAYPGVYAHTIGSAWGDYDNDGWLDLLASSLRHQWGWCFQDVTYLWHNEGDGLTFTEVHETAGIEFQETDSDVSWGDVDNDGWLDFYTTNVYQCQPATLYMNNGDGTFTNATYNSKLFTYNGWGVAMADTDGDGLLDVYARGYYRNRGPGGNYLKVKLRGRRCATPFQGANCSAIGARVTLEYGPGIQVREVQGGKGTGTQDSLVLHFGLGAETAVSRITVRWPSDCDDTIVDDPPVNSLVEVSETCVPAVEVDVLRGADASQALAPIGSWDGVGAFADNDPLGERLYFYEVDYPARIAVGWDPDNEHTLIAIR